MKRPTMGALLGAAVVLALLGVQPSGMGAAQGLEGGGSAAVTALAGNTFTYQGFLTYNNQPANGQYDFVFSLYADAAGTQWVADAAAVNNLQVTRGLFTAVVDLDDAMYGDIHFYLNGQARYLRIGVRPGASIGSYTYLTPLQALTPVPYAQALPGLHTVQNDTSANVVGGYYGNSVSVTAVGGAIGGGGNASQYNRVTGSYGTVSGGRGNTAAEQAAVGGGSSNNAGGVAATIGGGAGNTANATDATVAGGGGNMATDLFATVGGGDVNFANGEASTVGGGEGNTADGAYATVPGGRSNYAGFDYSFAAGRRAKAYHAGAFVWADSTDADLQSTVADEFRVRASNGAVFIADSELYGLSVHNTSTTNGDGLRAYADVSKGENWGAVYAINWGTSPGIYAYSGGTFAGVFVKPIKVNGACVGCTMMYVARNDGAEPLETGDVVAVAGVAEPLAGSIDPVLLVRRAEAGGTPVGVVRSRAVVAAGAKDGRQLDSVDAAPGPAAPGEYLFLVVQGVAQVKADATGGAIAPGARLAAAGPAGHARALQTRTVDGMIVAEGAPVLGIALGPLDAGTGLIPVLVTLK